MNIENTKINDEWKEHVTSEKRLNLERKKL